MPIPDNEHSWNAGTIADFRAHEGRITGRSAGRQQPPADDLDRRPQRRAADGPARLHP